MEQPQPCCQNPATLLQGKPPFSKIVALGFYDGPTSGILQCASCEAVYRFDMLDWDEDHDVRIFRLASLPPNSLADCVKALAQTEAPDWPVWVPWGRDSPSEEARTIADQEVQRILDRVGPAELVVAWLGYGERILAAKKVPAAELNSVLDWFSLADPAEARDWFSLLGLIRGKKAACP